MAKGPKPTPPNERFWKYVNKSDGCWEWTGMTNGRYPLFYVGRERGREYAHRFSWETANAAKIPDGLVVNHLCINPLCVRPDHLEVTTYRANSRYGNGPAARRSRQTLCCKGHPLDGVKPNGCRRCLTCHRERQARYKARKQADSE